MHPEYCDNCGEFTDELHSVPSLPTNISSANKGESAVLCTTCNQKHIMPYCAIIQDSVTGNTYASPISRQTVLNCQVYHTFTRSQLDEEMIRISHEIMDCQALRNRVRSQGEESAVDSLNDEIEFLDHYSSRIRNRLA